MESLQDQNREMRAELQLRVKDGAIMALMQRFGLEAQLALLLIALYQAKGRGLTKEFLVDYIGTTTKYTLRTQVSRLRDKIGDDTVVTINKVGYAITPIGSARVLAAIEPPAIQDPRPPLEAA